MRELKIANSKNLTGSKEFNHMRITNIDHYLDSYKCKFDYYKSPFEILAELEEKIKYENNPEATILCSYKPDGEVVFLLESIKEQDDLRIVEYRFENFVS